MEDRNDDLTNLPEALRKQIISFRYARELGLRELVHRQNCDFLQAVEAEMWAMLVLPGQVQPGMIMAIVGTVLSKEVRKQARINVLEANALRIADYKQTTKQQEADIRRVYLMSLRARQKMEQESPELAD